MNLEGRSAGVVVLVVAAALVALGVFLYQSRNVDPVERCRDLGSRDVISGEEEDEMRELGCEDAQTQSFYDPPDVVGLQMNDALAVLEEEGFQVYSYSRGVVTEQGIGSTQTKDGLVPTHVMLGGTSDTTHPVSCPDFFQSCPLMSGE